MTIYDMHTHFMGFQYEQDKRTLLRAMELYDISRIYVSGLSQLPNPMEWMIDEANAAVAKFAKEYPDQVSGYIYISPEHKNAMDVLRRGIEEQGLEGVKLWVSTFCDDPCVFPIVEQCIEYGIPILVHAFHKAVNQLPNETTGKHTAALARRYPQAKLIMAHLGGNCYHGLPAIRDCPNVWVDYSGSLFRGDELQYAVDLLGVDRIVYGSDMPGPYLDNLGQLLELGLPEEDRDKIAYKNTQKLFDRSFRLDEGGRAK